MNSPSHSRPPVWAAVVRIHAGVWWEGRRDEPEHQLKANPLQNIQTAFERPLPPYQTHPFKQRDKFVICYNDDDSALCHAIAHHKSTELTGRVWQEPEILPGLTDHSLQSNTCMNETEENYCGRYKLNIYNKFNLPYCPFHSRNFTLHWEYSKQFNMWLIFVTVPLRKMMRVMKCTYTEYLLWICVQEQMRVFKKNKTSDVAWAPRERRQRSRVLSRELSQPT